MDFEIREALSSLRQAIEGARGPIFTDADWGRVHRAFMSVCEAISEQDRRFKAKAAEAERVEKERERESTRRSLLVGLNDELGIGGAHDD